MNKKLWIILIIFALITPIILNIIIGSTNPLDSIRVVGAEDDWLGFYGAYIGALVGALITLYAMFRESKNNALNIMISNQENLIKDLRERLSERIGAFLFGDIGYVALITTKQDYDLNVKDIVEVIIELNGRANHITGQCNAWGVIYKSDSRKIVQKFNAAYIDCRDAYNNDVKKLTTQLNELRPDIRENVSQFNIWLTDFIKNTLMEHQQTYTKQMLDIANEWLQTEQDKLDNLRNQLYSPKIGIKWK